MDNLIETLKVLASGETNGIDVRAVAQDALDRLGEYEKSLKTWTLISSTHHMHDGSHVACHPLVGVNEWRGEEWVNFYQLSLEEFLSVMEALEEESEIIEDGDQEDS